MNKKGSNQYKNKYYNWLGLSKKVYHDILWLFLLVLILSWSFYLFYKPPELISAVMDQYPSGVCKTDKKTNLILRPVKKAREYHGRLFLKVPANYNICFYTDLNLFCSYLFFIFKQFRVFIFKIRNGFLKINSIMSRPVD